MIVSVEDWRAAWSRSGLPSDAVPSRSDLGLRYPWKAVAIRAMSAEHRRKVAIAQDRLRTCLASPGLTWRLGWSAGKDSTALAALAASIGVRLRCFGEKDDLDYPAEELCLQRLSSEFGHEVDIIRPRVKLIEWLAQKGIDLTSDLHGQAAELSSEHFYGLLNEHRAREGYTAVLMGLRAAESRGRKMNRAMRGWLYTRQDGLSVGNPLVDWEDMDVHAFLVARNIPLLPMYLCLDVGMDAMKMRKSWWVAGGIMANLGGHYTWLRRWWPDLWEQAATIDPRVRLLS
jgi:3'-phosphoadenosine 5'-phosphosulfate sulfotransferase (PAPS reductase)/FAD synthetase